jgi:hypothetical protein
VAVRSQLGQLGDAAGQRRLDEEVLSERLPGADPVAGSKSP